MRVCVPVVFKRLALAPGVHAGLISGLHAANVPPAGCAANHASTSSGRYRTSLPTRINRGPRPSNLHRRRAWTVTPRYAAICFSSWRIRSFFVIDYIFLPLAKTPKTQPLMWCHRSIHTSVAIQSVVRRLRTSIGVGSWWTTSASLNPCVFRYFSAAASTS